MKLSIFTPTHDSKYLQEVYESIKDQDFDEWVILYNNGATSVHIEDLRIKEIQVENAFGNNIGAYKKLASLNCSGDVLLELDHDDFLVPGAIEEIRWAFKDNSVGFVYSNSLYTDMEWKPPQRFSEVHGWKYRETPYSDHILDEPICFDMSPAAISRIWYAPDHLRAFRKDVYEKVGGYDPNLKVLDDQDLMCRMYIESKFHHIDKGLYVYRVHHDNSWITHNREIQDGVYPLYDKYIEQLILKWATDQGLLKLDLGGRFNKTKGYLTVDMKNADILRNLNLDWHIDDSSVGVVRAFDIFEHLRNPIHVMKELYRVLTPGGYALIQVPSTDGRGAFQDPTHVSFWNENSFLYYTDSNWSKYIDTPVRFQLMRSYTSEKDSYGVCWTTVHLVSLKDGFRPPGIVAI